MNTQTTGYIWRTLLFSGLALALCQTAFLLMLTTPLAWIIGWLHPIGPLVITLVVFPFITRRLPLPPRYALTLLPVVLYTSGILAVLFVWWAREGADPYAYPFTPVISITIGLYGWYGLYGATAGLLWVGCLLRTWKYARAAHHTQTGVPD